MAIREIESDSDLVQLLSESASKLLVIDFWAGWCRPCRMIKPLFEQLAGQYASSAIFARCDVDSVASVAARYSVSAMPTFKFIKNSQVVAELKGADPEQLKKLVAQHATAQATSGSSSGQSAGQSKAHGQPLTQYIDKANMDCLNESPEHTIKHLFGSGYLESDADEQLLLSLPTQQVIKIKAIKFRTDSSAADRAPKSVKLFVDRQNLGFDDLDATEVTQELELSAEQAAGQQIVELRFVKFVRVSHLTIAVLSNQGDAEVTRIDSLELFGESGDATGDMNALRKSHDD